ncbi:hypothetical protein GCM10010300_52080 [Streptomyces olivaceoviridis]|uniref:hypothetical protein n=1 Tax=Streptomyces olivaceoviridis TaxID=1921 RepID=UPI001674CDEF|nr:hypothetical protein [Streptomyces olivaceoviridis]GGZ01640.1 hypothetical protein GCM10010300_52080 [Streptomyces olivaceoviridis]
MFSARDDTEVRVALYFACGPPAYDRHDVAEHRRVVAEHFAGTGWEVPRPLRRMAAADGVRGTSQALIGACVLAGEPAAADGRHTEAFAAYEREMRGFVDEHQRIGQGMPNGVSSTL